MKTIKNLLVVLGFGLLSATAWAQCAPGGQFIEQQGQGVTYGICTYPSGNYYTHGANETPVPTGSGSSGSSGSARPQPPKIINRYGAVAMNSKTGGYDSSFGQDSSKQASKQALDKCGSGCRIIATYANTCAAMSWGSYQNSSAKNGKTSVEFGANSQIAEANALKSCKAKGNQNCQIVFSECSKYK
jgi:hypothetical protein